MSSDGKFGTSGTVVMVGGSSPRLMTSACCQQCESHELSHVPLSLVTVTPGIAKAVMAGRASKAVRISMINCLFRREGLENLSFERLNACMLEVAGKLRFMRPVSKTN